MKKLYLLIMLFISVVGSAAAQQKPQFSQYMLNNYLHNPAITGIEDYSDLRLGFRQQWLGLENAPRTFYTSFHTPINKTDQNARKSFRVRNGAVIETTKPGSNKKNLYTPKGHHGIGTIILVDQAGALSTYGANVSYAYHLPLSKSLKLAGGTAMGIVHYRIDESKMGLLEENDPLFTQGNFRRYMYDLNLGLWLYSQQFYVGASTNQLVANRQNFIKTAEYKGESRLQKHYYLTAGYKIDLSPDFALIPSTLVKFAYPSPVSVDLNLKALYANRLFVGASYRREDAVAVIAGINISSAFDIGYSYDATTNSLNQNNLNTHELVLGIKLFNSKKIICPQFSW